MDKWTIHLRGLVYLMRFIFLQFLQSYIKHISAYQMDGFVPGHMCDT
jgi:hypothetical protein